MLFKNRMSTIVSKKPSKTPTFLKVNEQNTYWQVLQDENNDKKYNRIRYDKPINTNNNAFHNYIESSSTHEIEIIAPIDNGASPKKLIFKIMKKCLKKGTPFKRNYTPEYQTSCEEQIKNKCYDQEDGSRKSFMWLKIDGNTKAYGSHRCNFTLNENTWLMMLGYKEIYELLQISILQEKFPNLSEFEKMPKLPSPKILLESFFDVVNLDETDIEQLVKHIGILHKLGRDPLFDSYVDESMLNNYVNPINNNYRSNRRNINSLQNAKHRRSIIDNDDILFAQLRKFCEYLNCGGIISPIKRTYGMQREMNKNVITTTQSGWFDEEFVLYDCAYKLNIEDGSNEIDDTVSGGDKSTIVLYKGKQTKVYTGARGGKYVIINKKKQYV